jgi:hypothetical protein
MKCGQEIQDLIANFPKMGFQGKMAGIKEFHYSVREVLSKGLSSGREGKGIFVPPDSKERGLIFPEIVMKCRIQGNVGSVIFEEIELQFSFQIRPWFQS